MINAPILRCDFLQTLDRLIAAEYSTLTNLGVVLINIANLQKINHLYGFNAGDYLISTVYQRLQNLTKLPDTVFRTDGKHFVFILPALTNPAFITLASHKIKSELEQEIELNDISLTPVITLAIALDIDKTLSADELLAHAEQSLNNSDPQTLSLLNNLSNSAEAKLNNQELEKPFREALRNNQFQLYYQPKLNLKTGAIDQAEALLRWELAEHGFISPEVVVNLAEQCGESYTLTKWVVHTAARKITQWQQNFDIAVAINIQTSLLADSNLVHLIKDAVAIWGTDKHKLTLEITESAVIEDKESGLNSLLQLQEFGVGLSIDDFGTGYSSLSYFKDIPADELKIDQSFITHICNTPQDQALVKIIIGIAHLFNLKVVAEGIEDKETLNLLIDLGCDYAQGYYIARPMPDTDFEAWMHANRQFDINR